MSPHDLLKAARALIAEPERWTQGACARDTSGRACTTVSPHAVRYDTIGALDAAGSDDRNYNEARRALLVAIGDPVCGLSGWNDTHTHAEVLAGWDAAIAATAPAQEKT